MKSQSNVYVACDKVTPWADAHAKLFRRRLRRVRDRRYIGRDIDTFVALPQGPSCVAVSYNHQAAIHHRSLCRGDLVAGPTVLRAFLSPVASPAFFLPPCRRFSALFKIWQFSQAAAPFFGNSAATSNANFISSTIILHPAETAILIFRRRLLLAKCDASLE